MVSGFLSELHRKLRFGLVGDWSVISRWHSRWMDKQETVLKARKSFQSNKYNGSKFWKFPAILTWFLHIFRKRILIIFSFFSDLRQCESVSGVRETSGIKSLYSEYSFGICVVHDSRDRRKVNRIYFLNLKFITPCFALQKITMETCKLVYILLVDSEYF